MSAGAADDVWTEGNQAAVSPTDAWAVGASNANFHLVDSLILHWDGEEWTVA